MRRDIVSELQRLEGAVQTLDDILRSPTRVGLLRYVFYCEACGGVFQPAPDGLRCSSCGNLIAVTWQDGRTPTARELRDWAGLPSPDDEVDTA